MKTDTVLLMAIVLILVLFISLVLFMIAYRCIYLKSIEMDPIKAFIPIVYEPERKFINKETGEETTWVKDLGDESRQENLKYG